MIAKSRWKRYRNWCPFKARLVPDIVKWCYVLATMRFYHIQIHSCPITGICGSLSLSLSILFWFFSIFLVLGINWNFKGVVCWVLFCHTHNLDLAPDNSGKFSGLISSPHCLSNRHIWHDLQLTWELLFFSSYTAISEQWIFVSVDHLYDIHGRPGESRHNFLAELTVGANLFH